MVQWLIVSFLLLLAHVPVSALSLDFEDGQVRGDPTAMKVPPKVMSEGGNRFMRITGSRGDCESLPGGMCPPRNRSTVRFTTPYNHMPLITNATMRQTYLANIRFHQDNGGSSFALYQDAPGGEGYGQSNGQGPVVKFSRNGGGLVDIEAFYANETKANRVQVRVPRGQWHQFRVDAVWSHDPRVGQIDVYVNGQLKLKVRGRDSNLGPTSNRIPELKMGMYGDNATGMVDVDNIRVSGGAGGGDGPMPPSEPTPPPPPVVQQPLPPPTNFRLVLK